jgi:hypothetical protein
MFTPKPSVYESTLILTVDVICAITATIGFVINTSLLYVFYKEPKLFKRKIDMAGAFIIFINFLWSGLATYQYFQILRVGYLDENNCQASGYLCLVIVGATMCAQFLMGLERYTTVVMGKKLKLRFFVCVFFILESALIVTATLQLTHKRRFEPVESGLYCFLPLTSDDPADIRLGWFTLGYTMFTINAVVMIYSQIYRKTYSVHTRVKNVMSRTTQNQTQNSNVEATEAAPVPKAAPVLAKTYSENQAKPSSDSMPLALRNLKVPGTKSKSRGDAMERAVFYRCVAVLGTFVGSYGLAAAKMFYNIITKQEAPLWLELLATTLSNLDNSVTPIILISMNRNFLKAVKHRIFGKQ